MEATISYDGGTTTVEGATLIERVRGDLKVWYGEPHDYENSTHELYANGSIVLVK